MILGCVTCLQGWKLPAGGAGDVVGHWGNNEVTRTDSLEEFVYTVKKSCDKLNELSKKSHVAVVMPTVPPVGASETGRLEYYKQALKSIESERIKTVQMNNIEYHDSHPTEQGTREILKQIDEMSGNKLILGEALPEDLTTRQRYSQVRALYKVGCRACDCTEYTSALCGNCVEEAKKTDVTSLKARIDEIQENMFPDLGENDVQMRNIIKRNRDNETNNGSDAGNINAKVPRT